MMAREGFAPCMHNHSGINILTLQPKQYVYVIVWVAVVFGINCASNAVRARV